jgi:hypothetical protein
VTGWREDDFNVHDGGVGGCSKAPPVDGLFGRQGEELVAGFDVGVGDGAVGQNGDVDDDSAGHAHAVRQLRVDRRDFRDDGSMFVDWIGSSRQGRVWAETETAAEQATDDEVGSEMQSSASAYRRCIGGELLGFS